MTILKNNLGEWEPRSAALLALLANPPTLPEMDSALRALQTRLLKLAPAAPTHEPIISVPVAQDVSLWFQRLTRAIADNFRVKATANYSNSLVKLTGYQDDAEYALSVLLAAKSGAQRLATAWWQKNPQEPMSVVDDHLHGIAVRFTNALALQVEKEGYAQRLLTPGLLEPEDDAWTMDLFVTSEAAYAAALQPGG